MLNTLLGADSKILGPAPLSEERLGPPLCWELGLLGPAPRWELELLGPTTACVRRLPLEVSTNAISGLSLRIFRRQLQHAKSPLRIQRE